VRIVTDGGAAELLAPLLLAAGYGALWCADCE